MIVRSVPPLVVMGASLGGLDALRVILRGLPGDFPAAIAIVQHRRQENQSRLAELLAVASKMPVMEPNDHEPLAASRVYLAPPGYHLLVDGPSLCLSTEAPVCFARPSIDVLFESAAVSHGASLASVLLTGSSEDGAAGSEAVYRAGGTTIVQDPRSAKSAVAPAAAIARHAPSHVVQVEAIAEILVGLSTPPSRSRGGTTT